MLIIYHVVFLHTDHQEWRKAKEKTIVKRVYSASVIDGNGNLWITGGEGEEASTTSEYITLNAESGSIKSEFGPELNMGGEYLPLFSYKNSNLITYWLINNSINMTNPLFESYLQEGRSMHC